MKENHKTRTVKKKRYLDIDTWITLLFSFLQMLENMLVLSSFKTSNWLPASVNAMSYFNKIYDGSFGN